MATNVEKNVVSRIGRKISEGLEALNCARYIMIVIGMIVKPDAFIHRNIIIELLAVSLFSFSSCNCCIAFKPIGVAALSNPKRLAEKFIKIEPVAGWSFGNSGNNLLKTGEANLAKRCTNPAFSPIFIKPNHNANIPVNPSDISNPVLAESNVEAMIFVKTSVSPKKTNLQIATMKAIKINPIQI